MKGACRRARDVVAGVALFADFCTDPDQILRTVTALFALLLFPLPKELNLCYFPRFMPTEADTCRRFVVPKLQGAGWDNEPYSIAEQRTITDGRIVPVGKSFIRRPPKRVDYLLRYRRDFPLAVVEAKVEYKTAADALQQAKRYAEMLGLKFAYATNGAEIIEFDYFTGLEKSISQYPKPEELWQRYRAGRDLKNDTEVE